MKPETSTMYPLTVQFEDIDISGVVHHPQYLKYLERARSQELKDCGFSVDTLYDMNIALAIATIQANYLRPARIDQQLQIFSEILSVGKTVIKIKQTIINLLPPQDFVPNSPSEEIQNLPQTIFWANLDLVCVDLKTARPRSLPPELKQALKAKAQPLVPRTSLSMAG